MWSWVGTNKKKNQDFCSGYNMSTVFVFFNSNYKRDSSHMTIALETWHSSDMATARLSGLYNMTTPVSTTWGYVTQKYVQWWCWSLNLLWQ